MGRLVLIAVRNLLQHKRRTFLVGGATVAVTIMLILLLGLANGIEQTMLRSATTLSTGHVNVGGFFKITSGQAAPVVTKFQAVRDFVLQNVPEVRLAVDRARGWGKIVSDKSSKQVGIVGVDVQAEKDFKGVLQLVSGNLDDLAQPATCLIFESQATRLALQVGDVATLSTPTFRGAYNSMDVKVVAIAKDVGLISSFNIIVQKQTVRDLYLLDDNATGAIQLYLEDPTKTEEVAERLRKLLAEHYPVIDAQSTPFWQKFQVVTREDWTGQKLDVSTWKDELSFVAWVLDLVRGVTTAFTSVLMIIILIGVMNSMWMSIRERTREIGTLRAIGMGKSRVLLMFLMEASLLSVVATLVGAGLGIGLAGIINAAQVKVPQALMLFLMRDTLHLAVTPAAVAVSVLVISGVTTLFALYPAYRATRLKPITAIHDVG